MSGMTTELSRRRSRWEFEGYDYGAPDGGLLSNETFASPKRAKMARRFVPRRASRRGRRRYRRRRQIGWGMRTVLPYAVSRKLRTVETTAVDSAAGALGGAVIKLNSAFDPMGALSASTQPLGFDQYEALYSRYCVVGYRILFEVVSLDNTTPVEIGFTPSLESSLFTSYQRYKEQPATTSRIVTPDMDKVVFGRKGKVKPWMMPRGGRMLTEDLVTAVTTTDPAKLLYGHIWSQPVDGSSDPGVIRIVITLEQIVVFFSPKSLARSAQ